MQLSWTIFQPSPPLQAIIRDYILLRSSATLVQPHGGVILPRANFSLFLNLGHPLHHTTTLPVAKDAMTATMIEPQIQPHTIVYQGHVDAIGINFRVGYVVPFQCSSLSRLFGNTSSQVDTLEILKRLECCTELQKRIQIIEEMLLTQTQVSKCTRLHHAINYIVTHQGAITIQQLCDDLFISSRQLERLFKQYVGLPPKRYARLVRFNHILQYMHDTDVLPHGDIANHYYDQSHFIREFKQFASSAPTSYLNRPPTYLRDKTLFVDRVAHLK
ncbi:MAG: helix-turn-helix domain-containing protein [Chloroflexota bacterium]